MKTPGESIVGRLQRRIRVARGQEPGDLVLIGGQVVNVFTGRVQPANVVLADGWIAGVGPFDWSARERVDLSGQVIVPGLIDGHIHVESTLLAPAELARLVVPRGTTALIADPHEVGNVLGVAGIDRLLELAEGLPLDLFCMASPCVPAVAWDDSGAALGPAQVRELLGRPRIRGLAEVMDFPAVLRGEAEILEKIEAARAAGDAVDGHAPALAGRDLVAYVAAGIRSDHESTHLDEARAKAELGMMVQVREGSTERNLDALLPALVADELGEWCLCSDDVYPDDLARRGHLDDLLRRVVSAGVPPARAVAHATLVPARHYGLRDRGAVAPGYRADLVVVNDLKEFRPTLVFKAGRLAARDGVYLGRTPPLPSPPENTVRLAPLDESAFRLPLAGDRGRVIRVIPDQITTRAELRPVGRRDGAWVFDPHSDVVLAASIERHQASGRIGLGLASGFGLKGEAALGSSVAHDSHNLILVGTNPRDLLGCVQALAEMGGGFVVSAGGQVRARLPLPFAGLLSLEKAEEVCRQLHAVQQAAADVGCCLNAPFGVLSFLALPVIPQLRLTTRGLFDVSAQQFVGVEA